MKNLIKMDDFGGVNNPYFWFNTQMAKQSLKKSGEFFTSQFSRARLAWEAWIDWYGSMVRASTRLAEKADEKSSASMVPP